MSQLFAFFFSLFSSLVFLVPSLQPKTIFASLWRHTSRRSEGHKAISVCNYFFHSPEVDQKHFVSFFLLLPHKRWRDFSRCCCCCQSSSFCTSLGPGGQFPIERNEVKKRSVVSKLRLICFYQLRFCLNFPCSSQVRSELFCSFVVAFCEATELVVYV